MRRRTAILIATAAVIGGVLGAILDSYGFFAGTKRWSDILTSWDWVAIGSVVTAVATIVLAGFAIGSGEVAKRALDAANRQAEASTKQALSTDSLAQAAGRQAEETRAMVGEMQLERVARRPVVNIVVDNRMVVDRETGISRSTYAATVSNVGRTPALRCGLNVHTFAEIHEWFSWGGFELAASSSDTFAIEFGSAPEQQVNRMLTDDLEPPTAAIGYQDEAGNKYRAAVVNGRIRRDFYRPGIDQAPAPAWINWES